MVFTSIKWTNHKTTDYSNCYTKLKCKFETCNYKSIQWTFLVDIQKVFMSNVTMSIHRLNAFSYSPLLNNGFNFTTLIEIIWWSVHVSTYVLNVSSLNELLSLWILKNIYVQSNNIDSQFGLLYFFLPLLNNGMNILLTIKS